MTSATRRTPLKLIYGGAFLLLIVTILIRYGIQNPRFWSDWIMILPVLQTVWAGFVSFQNRHSRAAHVHNAIATATILAMCGTIYVGKFDWLLVQILDAMIQIGLPVAWLFAAGGCLAIPMMIRRKWHLALKIWLLAVSTLLTAELSARWLEPAEADSLSFPGELPPPPQNEIHIAAMGGSSTLGYPYQPKFGFPQVAAWQVQRHYPNQTVVLRNLAQGGINLRHAIHELNELKYLPHVLLIYTGHNEFYHDMEEFTLAVQSGWHALDDWIDWSALYRTANRYVSQRKAVRESRSGIRRLIENPIATPVLYAKRLRRFRNQCEQLDAFCRRRGITPVWFIPAASESGFEPNRSGNFDRMSSGEQAEILRTEELVKQVEQAEAVEHYRRILEQFPDFAEYHFRLAQCLHDMGDLSGARHHFVQALESDGHPIRANNDYREVIRLTARNSNAPLVDTIDLLRPHVADKILGTTLFLDNVHMTLKGYYLTGLAGCEALLESDALTQSFGPPEQTEPLSLAKAIELAELNSDDLARAYRRTAFGLLELREWRFDRTVRNREAQRFLQMADALENRRIVPGEAGTESFGTD